MTDEEMNLDFLNKLKDESNTICFGIGSAGSGKSYISLSYALQAISDVSSPYRKIICLVPTCEAGNLNIGFLIILLYNQGNLPRN